MLLYIIDRMERGDRLTDMPDHVRHGYARAALLSPDWPDLKRRIEEGDE